MLILATASTTAAESLTCTLEAPCTVEVDGLIGQRGLIGGVDVAVHDVGVGRAAAAFALSRLLRRPPEAVLLLSVGPALPGSGLAEGDLAVASAETYADLGVEGRDGLRDLASLGVRLAPGAPGQTFLADPRLTDALTDAATRTGPFLTAETLATDEDTATARTARWGPALAETREGAAVAHACLLESVPFAHLRAIVGPFGQPPVDRAMPARALETTASAAPGIATALAHPFS